MLVANNPFTGETIAEYPSLDAEQVSERIGQAHSAFESWRSKSFAERADVLKAVAAELRKQKPAMAKLMADEMGKPVREGEPEVEKAAWCSEYYAEHAEAYLTAESLPSDASHSYVCYQPLGTLLGILPWNAPLWLAFRYLAPALMAGNTCVMKHDPNVPASAQAIADAFVAAGAPDNIMVNLPVETSQVEAAIRDPRIAAVSFTGSAGAGAKVAAVAGSEIKPTVLELGGSDPCIVLADADLESAADIAVLSRIINAGQSCIAAKRILVEQSVVDKFIPMLKERLQALKLGDPQNPDTQIGPIARRDLQLNLHRQVSETVDAGAICELGGELPDSAGYFYPPTLLTGVTPSMTAFHEETFGPVMAVTAVADIDEAIALANDSAYGLGAAIWTADVASAEKWALQIDTGQVAINGIVKTDPRLPSGGIKGSGYGRELGPHGIKEFVNAKQVWVK
ncbi:NAD-dependent succinate-semialdehyde dehydrogenase [Gilvimarinus sp. SDUM040013]|uniref:NAD-dependent succinate-semialdehyde dehydrogenase n=1 Tax=Gilvimarinus gilvus TaxID=3058038 RepID=A0ABU4RYC0_9GAMM|nr:NAD-dependent succinate-semialdehyde dehydrogenase [Gilvimarinus sp. SDUM040013]MDO3387433.1 NAD-dependent succinate-semialdehyde dehydrogenase [Gilvimarinus sp. SDUM040013]MDX6849910.1 NAD-dependent succinate-semialdehyde dehydrogenase [Gilvimarinus sp. SDUM040013]